MRLHRLLVAAAAASGAGVVLASSTAPVTASTAARWSGSISYHTSKTGSSTGIHTIKSSSDGRLTILIRQNGTARYQAAYHAESTSVADSDCGKQTKRNTWAGGNVRNNHGSVDVQPNGRKGYRISHTWPTVEVVHTFTHTSELAGQRNSFGHLCPPNPEPEKDIATWNPIDNPPVLRGTSRRNGNLLVGSKRTSWRPCSTDAICGAQTRATWTLVRVRRH